MLANIFNKNTIRKIKVLLVIIFTVALASLILTNIGPYLRMSEGFTNGELITTKNAYLSNITQNTTDATDGIYPDLDTKTSGSGTLATVDVVVTNGTVTSLTIKEKGSGYQIGDSIRVDKSKLVGSSTDLILTIKDTRSASGEPVAAVAADPAAADPTQTGESPADLSATNNFTFSNSSGTYNLKKNSNGCVSLAEDLIIDGNKPSDCGSLLTEYHNERVTVQSACGKQGDLSPCYPVYQKSKGVFGEVESLILDNKDNPTKVNFTYCPVAPSVGSYEEHSLCYSAPVDNTENDNITGADITGTDITGTDITGTDKINNTGTGN
tara:strand:+ start:573 stop:1544 length:972 start_codon:yes stop_codon:yes gene_type:complete